MFAYVVVSHNKPELVTRLLHRIRGLSPQAVIVLRHDTSACPVPAALPDGVHVGACGPLPWGDWSMVAAVLKELDWVVTHTEATHAVVISGQDYPVLPLEDWERSVTHLDGLMEAVRLEFQPHWGTRPPDGDETLIRYSYRWYRVPGSSSWTYESGFARIANRIVARLLGYIRPLAYYRILPRGRGTFLGIRRPWRRVTYKGGVWMMLSRRAIAHVLAQDLSPYRHTLSPDEAAIHSAVLSNPELRVELGDLTYASWEGSSPPEVLATTHLEAIVASAAPFARKVELERFLDVLDALSSGGGAETPARPTGAGAG